MAHEYGVDSEGSYKLEDTLSLLLLIQAPSCVHIIPVNLFIDKHLKLNYIVSILETIE